MNEIITMNLNKREKEYFDHLESLSYREYNSVIKNEIEKVFDSVKNYKKRIKSKRLINNSGIFRKTYDNVKCASGVKYGYLKEGY